MRKRINIALFCAIGILSFFAAPKQPTEVVAASQADAGTDYTQDVPLDAVHFPDEHFRGEIAKAVDENQDGVLSREEREDIYYLQLGSSDHSWLYDFWDDGMDWYINNDYYDYNYEQSYYTVNVNHSLWINTCKKGELRTNVTGIEYFYNLKEVKVDVYELVEGSFQKNKNLKKIRVACSQMGQKSYDDVLNDFTVSRLTYMYLKNIEMKQAKFSEAPNLRVLRIICPKETGQTNSLDFSANTELRELELANFVPANLNLTKNQELKSLKVYSGDEKHTLSNSYRIDSQYYVRYEYFQLAAECKCRIQFAKNNNLRTLYYFTSDSSIDISNLERLEDFQTLSDIDVKVKSSWIKKNFTKKFCGCAIVRSGKIMKDIKASKGKYTVISQAGSTGRNMPLRIKVRMNQNVDNVRLRGYSDDRTEDEKMRDDGARIKTEGLSGKKVLTLRQFRNKISQRRMNQCISQNVNRLIIESADNDEITLKRAGKLEELEIRNCWNLKKLNLKGAKKLKKLVIDNAPVRTLDLTGNFKLTEVSIHSGSSCLRYDEKKGEVGKADIFPWSYFSCDVRFAKKNNIQKLSYYTTNQSIDLSNCRKIREIHLPKNCNVKTDAKWYQKNKRKLSVYADGLLQNKLKTGKKDKSILLKTQVKDGGIDRYMWFDDEEKRECGDPKYLNATALELFW